MPLIPVHSLAAALAAVTSLTALAADEPATSEITRGKALHDEHCLRCHGTAVYTRVDRRIDSPAALEAQVERCAAGPADVDWTEDQILAVKRYLAKTYYGF